MNDEILNWFEDANIGRCYRNVSLSKYTTYKVGGNASIMIYPKDICALIKCLKYIRKNKIKYMILGNGSNVLFSDNLYDGVIIKLDEFDNLKFYGRNKILVGAGYPLSKLAIVASKKGLAGLEFAAGIPGSVGGAVYMNAGAYKSDMGYVVRQVKVLTPDFKIITLENRELDFHYRTSFLKTHKDYVCLEATIKLMRGDKNILSDVIKDRRKRRIESQPLEYPSAGSVFRNPEGNYAGKLIEDIGLKGKTIGGAKISDKHANFVINYDNASSSDIKKLIDYAHDEVFKKYNIDMKVEQEFINWE